MPHQVTKTHTLGAFTIAVPSVWHALTLNKYLISALQGVYSNAVSSKSLPSPAFNFPSHLPCFCFLSPLSDLCRRLCLPLPEFKFHEVRVLFYLVLCLSPEPSQHLKIIQNTFNYQWMNTIPIMGTNSMIHMKRVWKCIVINVRHYYNLNFCCLNPDNRNTNSINSALSILPKVFGFLRSVHIMCPYCASKNVYLNK